MRILNKSYIFIFAKGHFPGFTTSTVVPSPQLYEPSAFLTAVTENERQSIPRLKRQKPT
jgi:hypothetical protein